MNDAMKVWSVTPAGTEARVQRGRNVSRVAADVTVDTPTPSSKRGSGVVFANLSTQKRTIAKRPFSRLSAPAFDPALATRNPGC